MNAVAPRRRSLSLLLVPALALAACSSGSSPTEPAPEPVATPAPAPAPTPTAGQPVDFDGRVVDATSTGRRLLLASGTSVVVRADTVFDATGDLFSRRQVAAAFAAGSRVRVEGDGVRTGDGSVRAIELKAEVDE